MLSTGRRINMGEKELYLQQKDVYEGFCKFLKLQIGGLL